MACRGIDMKRKASLVNVAQSLQNRRVYQSQLTPRESISAPKGVVDYLVEPERQTGMCWIRAEELRMGAGQIIIEQLDDVSQLGVRAKHWPDAMEILLLRFSGPFRGMLLFDYRDPGVPPPTRGSRAAAA